MLASVGVTDEPACCISYAINVECNAAEHGIPWRRGYLFHGPPGSGKTSLVTALAGRLHKSISVVDLSSPYLNDGVRCMAAALLNP